MLAERPEFGCSVLKCGVFSGNNLGLVIHLMHKAFVERQGRLWLAGCMWYCSGGFSRGTDKLDGGTEVGDSAGWTAAGDRGGKVQRNVGIRSGDSTRATLTAYA